MHILIYTLKVQLGNKTIEIINLITVKVKIWDYGQQAKNHIEASEYCKYLTFFFFLILVLVSWFFIMFVCYPAHLDSSIF